MPVPLAVPIVMAGVGAGLSIYADRARNEAIAATAAANQRSTQLLLNQKRSIQTNQLLDKANDVNNQIGAALTSLGFQERTAEAQTTAKAAETNVYGQTAAKLQQKVSMDAAIMEDNIVQQGEAAMKDIQISLSNAKYEYDSGSMQNAMNYKNAMSQQKSETEIGLSAIQSGMQFGSAGYNF